MYCMHAAVLFVSSDIELVNMAAKDAQSNNSFSRKQLSNLFLA